tara:strand:- start:550 stop:915 length:366 start_codon:yes stop_codon:yes gene_type:complete
MKDYTGGCHCGAIRFSFQSDDTAEIWKCNCLICSMSDYDHLFIKHSLFKIITGEKYLKEYVFGTKSAKHFFCKICGIKSFYQPRSHPDAYSINLKCVDSPPEVCKIVKFDGKNFEESIKRI